MAVPFGCSPLEPARVAVGAVDRELLGAVIDLVKDRDHVVCHPFMYRDALRLGYLRAGRVEVPDLDRHRLHVFGGLGGLLKSK